jgi:hypothetical protein
MQENNLKKFQTSQYKAIYQKIIRHQDFFPFSQKFFQKNLIGIDTIGIF